MSKVILWFAISLFLSSFLLFLVEPMVGKTVLPALGGTPAVWNTCMVFFQAVLLAGYAYAHESINWLGGRRQAVVHVALLLAPLVLLPIAIDTKSAPSTDNPSLWLLWRLLMGVGLPFFVVSASAPLLQRWFSETGHAAGQDPYFLYSASNLGSVLALLAYPTVVESTLPLAAQGRVWTWAYVLLVALAVGCAILLWRSSRGTAPAGRRGQTGVVLSGQEVNKSPEMIGMRRRLRWIMLSFAPSSLMLGLTTYVTTDLAPVPLLWVIPLALYLVSFIWVFARWTPVPHSWLVLVFPFIVAPTLLLAGPCDTGFRLALSPVHIAAFFVIALVCHGELAADRPAAGRLTEFYLLMSVGGVMGGLFNALAAPVLFDSLVEYPLVMLLSCLLVGGTGVRFNGAIGSSKRRAEGVTDATNVETALRVPPMVRWTDLAIPLLVGVGTWGATTILLPMRSWQAISVFWMFVLAASSLVFRKRRVRFSLTLGSILLALFASVKIHQPVSQLHKSRNFFGPKCVVSDRDGRCYHTLFVGNTAHGMQWLDPERHTMPTAYYDRSGPVGDIFRACLLRAGGPPSQVAIIGLGAGAMAAYATPGQNFTFYEIDPEIARIAANPSLFTFLEDCHGKVAVVLGDGRLTLAKTPDAQYGLIIVDAFTSDAIPTHLLTREAMQLYFSKLDAQGLLAFHVTNRYVDLPPLLTALAQDLGLVSRYREDLTLTSVEQANGKLPSQYMVLARKPEDLRSLSTNPNWREGPAREGLQAWSDQQTNIYRLLKW